MNNPPHLKNLLIIQIILVAALSVPVYFDTATPFFFVKSDSMAPRIPHGSFILISHRESIMKSLAGKVIVFYNPMEEKTVVHRVLKEEKGYFLTKGENNDAMDQFRPPRKNILGVVIFTLRLVPQH